MLIEEYIFNCKLDKNSKYFGCLLAEIAIGLLKENDVSGVDFVYNLCHFFNKANHDYWKFYFSDGSLIVLDDWQNESINYYIFANELDFCKWLGSRG